ncbi:MAG: arylesterase [Gammaproteobacteria bacterium]|nr:arylesterase [Gammaproteobacteria bacterium]
MNLLVLSLCAALSWGCGSDPELPLLAASDRVLAFGDSLTYGTGAPRGQSYPDVLAGLIGREVVNAGVPGEVTTEGLQRLGGVLEKVSPRLVVLCHGGNDMLRKKNLAAAESNLRSMIETIRGTGAAVIMLGVPRPGVFLSTAKFYERIAEDMRVPIEADIVPDLLGDRQYKSDTVHPNARGYAKLAAAIDKLLRERGAL